MSRWRWFIGIGSALAALLVAAPAAAQVAIDEDGVIAEPDSGDFPIGGWPEWDGDSWVVVVTGTATPCVEAGIDELVVSIDPLSLGISETVALDGADFSVALPMPTSATGFGATCTSADGETSFSAHSHPFFYSYGGWGAVLAEAFTPGGGDTVDGPGVLAGTGAAVGGLAFAGLASVSLGVVLLRRARRTT